MSKKKIGLLGLGTVGSGVWKLINRDHTDQFSIEKILVDNPQKEREVDVDPALITDNFADLLDELNLDIIVEVIGGIEPAATFISRALERGLDVITANKKLMAHRGDELLKTASDNNARLLFEASVAGAVPVIENLHRTVKVDDIEQITGIINGTSNFILSRLSQNKAGFEEVLAEAKDLGYAEADPRDDITGQDAVYKLALLASLAQKSWFSWQDIHRQGIADIEEIDHRAAEELELKFKLLALARSRPQGLELSVEPTLLPQNHPLARVDDAENSVRIESEAGGSLSFSGPGAGSLPTASAILRDLLRLGDRSYAPGSDSILDEPDESSAVRDRQNKGFIPREKHRSSYYIRGEGAEPESFSGIDIESSCEIGPEKVFLTTAATREELEKSLAESDLTVNAIYPLRKEI